MKLKVRNMVLAAALAVAASTPGVFAQADALVDMLQKKGLLNQQEANEVKEQAFKETREQMPGTKIQLCPWLNELKFYGDARLRYEFREGKSGRIVTPTSLNPWSPTAFQGAANGATGATSGYGDHYNRERWRYRLRFGAEAAFTDSFKGNLRLETSNNSRSTNVTFGDDAGPFGKANDGIFVGLAYLEYSPWDWCTVMGGKVPNELMTSSMVWDGDINPEGAFEKFKYKVNDSVELFATLGQFIYDDKNPDNNIATRGRDGDDVWMFVQQFGVSAKLSETTKMKVAPTVYVYSGGLGDTYPATAANAPLFDGTGTAALADNDLAINDLFIFEVPMELSFELMKQKFKLFSDFAMNLSGDGRAQHAGRPDQKDEVYAYQVGLGWGGTKKKGDMAAKVAWQHADLYSLDMNLVDSDLFDSKLNMEGIISDFSYAFTDFLVGKVTYAYAWRANKDLPTGYNGDIALNPMNDYQLLQCDLSWKY